MVVLFKNCRKFFTEGVIKDRIFEGYAAAYGNVDHDGDVLEPGVFAKSIKEAFPAGKIKVLWQHRDPLGMPVEMSEDSKGLYVKGKISKTMLGNEAIELISDGVVDSMSVGFRLVKDKFDYDAHGVRHIREGILMEFSPVTFPANEQAIITGLKTLSEISVYNSDRHLSEAYRREIVEELKKCVALLEKKPQPSTFDTGKPLAAAEIDDLIKSTFGDLAKQLRA